jgi:hypothetical protein
LFGGKAASQWSQQIVRESSHSYDEPVKTPSIVKPF